MKVEREKQEIEDDIRKDQEMVAATTAKFESSLQQLQTLVPKELGITVPKYTETRTQWIH